MKHRIAILILTLISVASQAFAADNAAAILGKASAKLRAAQSIKANYTLTSSAGAGIVRGEMLLADNKFRITSPQYTSWFDGTTQWVLNIPDNEVNISTPTAQELQMVNPIMVLNRFSREYTATLLKSPKTQYVLRLTAKRKNSDIRQAVVTLSSSTLLPENITLTASNGTTVTIKLAGLKTGAKLADTYFRFTPSAYPNVDIIDLR